MLLVVQSRLFLPLITTKEMGWWLETSLYVIKPEAMAYSGEIRTIIEKAVSGSFRRSLERYMPRLCFIGRGRIGDWRKCGSNPFPPFGDRYCSWRLRAWKYKDPIRPEEPVHYWRGKILRQCNSPSQKPTGSRERCSAFPPTVTQARAQQRPGLFIKNKVFDI